MILAISATDNVNVSLWNRIRIQITDGIQSAPKKQNADPNTASRTCYLAEICFEKCPKHWYLIRSVFKNGEKYYCNRVMMFRSRTLDIWKQKKFFILHKREILCGGSLMGLGCIQDCCWPPHTVMKPQLQTTTHNTTVRLTLSTTTPEHNCVSGRDIHNWIIKSGIALKRVPVPMSRVFLRLFFPWFESIWAPEKQTKIFSNSEFWAEIANYGSGSTILIGG